MSDITGIWSAAMDGDLERVKSLLKKGTDPNLRDSANYTALVRMSPKAKIIIPPVFGNTFWLS